MDLKTDFGDSLACPAVRLELGHILASPPFRNSKRCQSLLKYVVDETVEDRRAQLKERTVGVRVFGRDPAYDTTQDAVVRNAAVEVRKRLAQYYQDPQHRGEIRIELTSGSYVPEFVPLPSGHREADQSNTLEESSVQRPPLP